MALAPQLPALKGPRAWLARLGYPGLLFGGVFAFWLLTWLGIDLGPAVSIVVSVSAVLLVVLESFFPYAEAWRPSTRLMARDFLHTVFSSGLTANLLHAFALGGLVVLGQRLAGTPSGFWPHTWPFVVQLALALVVAELGAYWAHRSMHMSGLLWRMHAVHHSTERMHTLASGRTHPLNTLFTNALQSAGILLLGASPEVVAAVSVFTGVNGLLQHCNLDLRPGWLNLVVATSDHHRWHHSKRLEESNSNYGNNLIVWDRVFGSHFMPSTPPPVETGIEGATIPEHFGWHLAAPFVYPRFEDKAACAPAPVPAAVAAA